MYLNHWNLTERPFDERAGSRAFFASTTHQDALVKLRYAIEQRSTLALLVGGIGSGKSLVASVLADTLSVSHRVLRTVLAPTTAAEALVNICRQLRPTCGDTGVAPLPSAPEPEGIVYELLEQLDAQFRAGQHPVAMLDGAGSLDDDELHVLVEVLRELTNARACLTTILIGLPELAVRARHASVVDDMLHPQCIIVPLSATETAGYIQHRLQVAGIDEPVFTSDAIELIHDLSGGVPRRINRLCDMGLLIGFAHDSSQVDATQISAAQSEIHVLQPTRTAADLTRRPWRPLRRRALHVLAQ